MQIQHRIAGIPCIIDVTNFVLHKGDGYWAVSDEDSRDYFAADYVVCDRNGRPAPWLERKLTDAIHNEILTAIGEAA